LYRITGLDPNDPPPPFNEDHHKIYTEESWRLLTERVENTLKTGEEYEILAQMVRPDGEHREVAIYGGARFGPDATVTGLYGIVQDITSRRKMERAFWSQEEDLRITLESIGDAVISTDVRGTVLRMNPVAQRLTGWLFSDAEGKLLREVFRIENGETGAKVEDPVEQVLRTGRTIGLANHTKLVSKNGREYHIADSAAPIKDAVGRTRGVVLVFHDVTEEYELRRSLRRNEERLRSLFASMTEGVCLHRLVYDESGTPVNYTIQDVNPAFERMLKLSRENVIGKRATEAYRTEQPPYLEEYAAVAATGVSRQLEVYYEPMDTHFVISVFATEPDSFATVFLDVGDLQRARDELRAQRDFIEQIAETSPVSIVKVDKDGHVVYANRHAEAVLGIARDSLSNRSYADVQWDIKDLAGEPLPAEELPFRKVMARGEPVYDVRHSISWPEDRRILLSVNAAPLYAANGDFDGMVASITDITQRHHNEVRLQAALAEKDLLMKELNHRVKNNLAMITSLIELKVGELDDSQSFSGIIRQINSIHLIHDKLYRTGEITVVDARDYFTDLLRSIFDSFAAQPVALDLKLAETRISVRRAVPLGLIVNEIATNAIQHGFHSGGPHVFRATLAEDAERNRIVLTLSNSGGPFPDEIRLENPQSFGLRLISALIEQLEGTIDLQRRPYPVFTISIPREQ
jgi:PAS domain S-box-containing protein